MAKIKNPILFSEYFGSTQAEISKAGLIDPFLNVDTQLFIDPILLEQSSNQIISKDALASFRKRFEDFVRLLAISETEDDAAWKAAWRLLDLSEPPENGLGFGGSGRSGNSRPHSVREAIMRTARQIILLGAKDPEMISLMGFFEENVGPDTISDMTTRAIQNELAAITEQFCRTQKIPVESDPRFSGIDLPKFVDRSGQSKTIILVPIDIVRDLPVATDWSSIHDAVMANAEIRDRVNRYLASIIRPTVVQQKEALREAALGSSVSFEYFLAAVKEHTKCYDPNTDALGYYKLKKILAEKSKEFRFEQKYELSNGPDELMKFVLDTVDAFKRHVEKGNLWEELWIEGKPKKERAAQLIYYAMADCFCEANDIDISPEANMGGGPVDFKFSKGYRSRVVVEMKRSSGTVLHGYKKQLEIYKDASQTNYGIFVVIDFGDLGEKLTAINEIRNDRLRIGESASEIVVMDATKKMSASKRH